MSRRESVFGIYNKTGFTLLEILIAIALIGVMAAVVVPAIYRRQAGYAREHFVSELNGLLAFARQNALTTNGVQKVLFDLAARIVTLEQQKKGEDPLVQEPHFEPVQRAYRKTSITIPDSIEIKNFTVEGADEMGRPPTQRLTQIWFYLMPDGLAQDVVINATDLQEEGVDGQPRRIGLVLNPFSAQFDVYDTFQ